MSIRIFFSSAKNACGEIDFFVATIIGLVVSVLSTLFFDIIQLLVRFIDLIEHLI